MWITDVSEMMYRKCLKKKDDKKEYWSSIIDNQWIYLYCRYIKDRSELWSKLTESCWIYMYCLHINNRTDELKHKITEEYWLNEYKKNLDI